MPGKQYDNAFALLEKSFNDSQFMKAYQSLPVKKHEDHTSLRPAMTTFLSDTTESTVTTARDNDDNDEYDEADDDASEGSMHEGYGNMGAPTIALHRNNSGLPPTPPTQVREHPVESAHLVPLPTQQSGVSTPVQRQGPPTPDLTPPVTRTKTLNVSRPLMPQFASSRAESFVTAKEDPSVSSAHTSQLSLPLAETAAGKSWFDSSKDMLEASKEIVLGSFGLASTKEEEEEDAEEEGEGEATPTRQKSHASLREQASFEEPSIDAVSESDNTNLPRNVTVRKKRRKSHLNDLQQQQNGQRLGEVDAPPIKQIFPSVSGEVHAAAVDEAHSLPHKSSGNVDGDWHTAINDMLFKAMRDEKSKRLSGISQTSTTVEAMVISAPKQKRRTLRHAGKNLALRDDVSDTRSSLDSTGEVHRSPSLRHKKAQLLGRLDIARDDARVVSNPERQRQDRVQVIVVPERRSSQPQALGHQLRKHDKMHLLTDDQQRPIHQPRQPSPLLHDSTPDASPPRNAPFKLRHVSAPLPSNRSVYRKDQDAFFSANGSSLKLDLSPRLGWNRHSSHDEDLVSPISEHPPSSPFPALFDPAERHTEYATVGSTPDKADNASTKALFEYIPASPHHSLDQLHANARYLHPAQTPGSLSQFSDRTDSIDINQAHAVSLFPHGNNSLMIIQHLAANNRPNIYQIDTNRPTAAIDEVSTSTDSEDTPTEVKPLRPIFTAVVDEPTTPPMQTGQSADDFNIDSPLKNPRPAPPPPVVAVIPPTPDPNLEEQIAAAETSPTRPGPPQRSQSLVQKARRYSESIIQPFLPLVRTETRRPTSLHRPTSSHDRDTTLHPFWRPRGFWDDFSSSDSEDDYYDDDGHDRLPAGGDTSDVASLKRRRQLALLKWPRKMSVRMAGFRGSGGFLQGNSLGIDRHGSNVRRHYISVPKTFLLQRGSGGNERFGSNGAGEEGEKRSKSLSTNYSLPFFSSSPPSSRHGRGNASAGLEGKTGVVKRKGSRDLMGGLTYYSTESLRQRAGTGLQRSSQRSGRGKGVGWRGLGGKGMSVGRMRERFERRKVEREERKREVRRRELKGRIGSPRVVLV